MSERHSYKACTLLFSNITLKDDLTRLWNDFVANTSNSSKDLLGINHLAFLLQKIEGNGYLVHGIFFFDHVFITRTKLS